MLALVHSLPNHPFAPVAVNSKRIDELEWVCCSRDGEADHFDVELVADPFVQFEIRSVQILHVFGSLAVPNLKRALRRVVSRIAGDGGSRV